MAKIKLKFEEAMSRLENIAEKLEKGNLPLDRSLELFEEGMGLYELCSSQLEEAKKKIEVLTKSPSGKITARSFEPEEEDISKGEDEESRPR